MRRRVDLVAQVAGKVVEVRMPSQTVDFEKDDVLLTIERDDTSLRWRGPSPRLHRPSNVWPKSEDAAGRRVASGESWVRMKPTIFSKSRSCEQQNWR